MATSRKKSVKKAGWRQRLLSGTSLYGFELVVAGIGLLVTIGVVIYGIYALCNFGVDTATSSTPQFNGELSVWLMAAMIVWLPLTVFFYIRTRAETILNPRRETTVFHKFVVGAYRFVLLMAVIALLFSVVYSGIRLLIGIEEDTLSTVFRVLVPGVVAAGAAGAGMVAYNKTHIPSRQQFAIVLSVVSAVIMVAVLSVSVGSLRDETHDERVTTDLVTLQNQINAYSVEHSTVPANLSQLQGLPSELSARLGDYSYTYVSSVHYELCADYATDTSSRVTVTPAVSENSYTYYPDFYLHSKGHVCYNLSASYADDGSVGGPKEIPVSSQQSY